MAIARATLKAGTGNIKINNIFIDAYTPEFAKQKMMEPIRFAGDMSKYDLNIKVQGGGVTSQSEAVRLAAARTLVEATPTLKQVFLDYDRTLLVADVRRRESSKPNSQGQARSKRQKSYR